MKRTSFTDEQIIGILLYETMFRDLAQMRGGAGGDRKRGRRRTRADPLVTRKGPICGDVTHEYRRAS